MHTCSHLVYRVSFKVFFSLSYNKNARYIYDMYPSDTSEVQVSWTIIYFMGSDSLHCIFFFCISLVERSAQILASSYFLDNFHLAI